MEKEVWEVDLVLQGMLMDFEYRFLKRKTWHMIFYCLSSCRPSVLVTGRIEGPYIIYIRDGKSEQQTTFSGDILFFRHRFNRSDRSL